jgi:hypothetical protein
MKVIPETYLMKVIPETYPMKVIPETYLMKVIPETYLMKVIPETYLMKEHLNRGRVDKYKMSYSIFLKTTCKNLNLISIK